MLHTFANLAIDTFQQGKKTFISTFVTNDKLATILEEFVDAQTAYTKSATETGIKTVTELAKFATTQNYFGGK